MNFAPNSDGLRFYWDGAACRWIHPLELPNKKCVDLTGASDSEFEQFLRKFDPTIFENEINPPNHKPETQT